MSWNWTISWCERLTPGSEARVSKRAAIFNPVRVVVRLIGLTTASSLISGCPRQFRLMNETIRCSILFHLLVPGGKWPTVIRRAERVARSWR